MQNNIGYLQSCNYQGKHPNKHYIVLGLGHITSEIIVKSCHYSLVSLDLQ